MAQRTGSGRRSIPDFGVPAGNVMPGPDHHRRAEVPQGRGRGRHRQHHGMVRLRRLQLPRGDHRPGILPLEQPDRAAARVPGPGADVDLLQQHDAGCAARAVPDRRPLRRRVGELQHRGRPVRRHHAAARGGAAGRDRRADHACGAAHRGRRGRAGDGVLHPRVGRAEAARFSARRGLGAGSRRAEAGAARCGSVHCGRSAEKFAQPGGRVNHRTWQRTAHRRPPVRIPSKLRDWNRAARSRPATHRRARPLPPTPSRIRSVPSRVRRNGCGWRESPWWSYWSRCSSPLMREDC